MTCKEWRSKQKRVRKAEQERAESIAYYNEHKEEIEIGRKAALIIAYISSVSPIQLDIEDILCKVASFEELDFYYKWCCEVSFDA